MCVMLKWWSDCGKMVVRKVGEETSPLMMWMLGEPRDLSGSELVLQQQIRV